MKTRNVYRILIGVLMLISGLVTGIISNGEVIIGTILLCAGLTFLITGIMRHWKYGNETESDERSRKIGAYGITYAWLTGLIFMTALFWVDYLKLLVLTTQTALAVSVIVLTVSAVIYQTWLFRKGDVD